MYARIKWALLASAAVLMISADAWGESFCIDPGHGGSDPGATGCGLIESHLTLDVSKQVRDLLKAAGHTVYMTRESDVDVGLSARANYANSKGVRSFASIHINSFNASSTGIETFCYTGCLASKSTGYQQASKIQTQMLAVWSLANRGVKEANYAVVRETNMPATLSELAFISNCGADYSYLSSPAHLKEAAQAHCKALTAQWAGGAASACSGGGSSGGETPKTGKVMAGTFKNSLDDTSDGNWLGGVKYTIGSQSQTSAASKTMMTFEVPVGAFTATASKDGYNTAKRTDCSPASASEISWCSIALTPVAAPPSKGKLSGAVKDAGSQAKVAATVSVNGATIKYDGNNNWVSGDLDPKTYTVEATADGYDKGTASCKVEANKTNDCPITLNPKKGTITGIVFDNATKAQIDASLTLGNMNSTSTATTKYQFSVDAGSYTITASSAGYDSANKSCTAERGKTTTCDIGLNKAAASKGTLKGTLKDKTSGKALAGKVSVTGQPEFACDQTGLYQFSLDPGTYQATGTATGYQSATVSCDVASNAATTCDIALEPDASEVVGTVFDASTQAAIAATVTIDGRTVEYNGKDNWTASLAPGTYTLTAKADGYREGSSTCHVTAGIQNVCNIALVAEGVSVGALNGIVYDVKGGLNDKKEPLLPLVAEITVKGFEPVSSSADGKWSVDKLPVASHEVTAQKDGYHSKTVTCKVVADQSSYCPIGLEMKKANSGTTPGSEEVIPADVTLVGDDCSAAPLENRQSHRPWFAAFLGLIAVLGIRRRNAKEMK